MKNKFFISVMMLAFCFNLQSVVAQEVAADKAEASKGDPKKDELIKTYAWTKPHFENTATPVLAIKQMQSAEGHEFVLIESEDSKTLYDTSGKQYCADHAQLDCVDFYKLSPSDLTWKRS